MNAHTMSGRRSSTPSRRPRKSTVATGFGPDNSLNFLRLILAMVVMTSHGWSLGEFGLLRLGHYDVSALAVDGFFVISGFLVTRSNARMGSTTRFLWHRFLRIYPAFWVCLVVVAGFFAPLGWLHAHGSLHGFMSARHGPLQYIVGNSTLHIKFYDVAGTPVGGSLPAKYSTQPGAWNGALWSLWWELLCYLGIAVLGLVGVLQRRRSVVVLLTAIMWAALVVHRLAPDFASGLLGSSFADGTLRLGPLFLSGSFFFLYGNRVPVSGWLAAVAALLVTGSMFLAEPHLIMPVPLAYLCLWLGIRLPFHRIGAKNDLSYGLYIYSSPMQQLMALYGVQYHGALVYFSLFTAGSVALATASWFAIERHALRMKNWVPRRGIVHRLPPQVELQRQDKNQQYWTVAAIGTGDHGDPRREDDGQSG
ncbi:acyltransferase [Frankia sp. Cppng1_Ct_nod]|uniref:acyltransferase family protein n=1 Tax=Frankia sp. Cppng1_Ct_nod TaxID=2897162 RepID=UPI0010417790|nr:acyltransferase [Frankia sp. Cppng1_Ct_nod]